MPYTVPTADDLKLEYPAFASVDDAVIERQISNAQAIVTTSWFEADYQPAILAYAAHRLALNGAGTGGGSAAQLAEMGVTSFKSGTMDVSFATDAVKAKSAGGYSSTRYGRDFIPYLRRNTDSGAKLVGCA